MPRPDDITKYEQLAKLKVDRLRELAAADTELTSAATTAKPELLDALATAYGFTLPKQLRAERVKKLKGELLPFKKQRDELLAKSPKERDTKLLDGARAQIKRYKRQMRKVAKAR